jgi:ribosomal protein S18 acetylase RimI-like enzyme
MKKLQIRPATHADIPTLQQLEQAVIKTERPFDATLKPDPLTYYDLPLLIESPRAELLVGIWEGEICACGYAKIVQSPAYCQHEEYAYLGFMCVAEAYRGQGFNRQILEALQQWAKAQGLVECRLEVYAENEAAIRAYEKAGYVTRLLEMRLGV